MDAEAWASGQLPFSELKPPPMMSVTCGDYSCAGSASGGWGRCALDDLSIEVDLFEIEEEEDEDEEDEDEDADIEVCPPALSPSCPLRKTRGVGIFVLW